MDAYGIVPKDFVENLKFRVRMRRRCETDLGLRKAMIDRCREDVLFFFSAFCFLHEPRPMKDSQGRVLPEVIPFIPWTHQEELIPIIRENLGFEDIAVEKARGEGMTWIAILLALHDWLFAIPGTRMVTIGVVSRNMEMADTSSDISSLMAKSLAVGTAVLTPEGFVPIESLSRGDLVIGSDGRPTEVVASLEEYEAELFRVTFNDGTFVDCTRDHLWPVRSHEERSKLIQRKKRGSDKSVPHRLVNPVSLSQSLRGNGSCNKSWNWELTPTPLIPFQQRELPIDPYVLGVLLGDGSLSQTGVTFASVDDEIVSEVRTCLGGDFVLRKTGECSWIISLRERKTQWSVNPISSALRALGLRGKRAWEKFIPRQYLASGIEQRLSLLQGLLDTDGSVSNQSGTARFDSTSTSLAEDVVQLVLSLGGTATHKEYPAHYTCGNRRVSGRNVHRVCIGIRGMVPFRLPRKAGRCRDRMQTTARRVVGVEPIGVGKAKCISVAADDGLFVTKGFLLTHNCDWELERLPGWMAGKKDVDYKRLVKDHTLRNFRNNCVITAYAATGEVGSGGRYSYFILDELPKFEPGRDHEALTSTQQTTKSRLIIGTPYGSEGAYYDVMHQASSMVKLVLRWEDNPTRKRGLYRMVAGVPVAADPASNPLPADYNPPTQEVLDLFTRLRKKGFRLEKRLRSPWYDHECDRPDANPFNIAQELDRDYGGSMFRIFTDDFFTAANVTVRPPFCRVSVLYDDELQPTVNRASDGELALWMTLDTRNRPPDHLYIVGVDLSTGIGGTYTSNSVLQVIDAVTTEQVGELASNTIAPDNFADLSVAVCNWLGNAYLAWERNGPGAGYTTRIKEIGYPNVYLRTKLFDKRRRKKIKEPGWWTDNKSKEVLFSELKRIVAIEELKVHSNSFVKECEQYIRVGKSIQHVASARAQSDSPDSGDNHGDRVIAMGIAVQALRDRPLSVPGRSTPTAIEPGSIEERDRDYAESLRAVADDDWDGRSNWDLMMGRSAGTPEL